ncbi:hypothetical protein [Clostridium novyi]|uniref:hypothetical protein n=1 Tax=Clostridium novyi TaxID=1542 RepID=UPI0004DAF9EB|nr:hypothetical protein [Clostridium novyi]KEH84548.1 hypothetical protein Z966_p0001 [Clostridium novyi A str. NCTC 538]KEH84621.1 hypothetical protein Z967_p0001 [Clostridium novyi A str. 4540]KEH84698.1 hypothetical protein Z965_p0001 [Clostridium novyi A str. BKT29909]KEH88842.1 hypothetical protein Z964_p0001 [Clostridium novyi A str. GD211209]
MLNYLLKTFIRKNLTTKNTRNVDELLYYKTVYSTYIKTSSNFQFAIENGFLNYKEIQYIKSTLNIYISKKHRYRDYKYNNYKNDVQEIYDKLQCKVLSKKQLLKLDEYITDIVASKSLKISTFVPVPNISQS